MRCRTLPSALHFSLTARYFVYCLSRCCRVLRVSSVFLRLVSVPPSGKAKPGYIAQVRFPVTLYHYPGDAPHCVSIIWLAPGGGPALLWCLLASAGPLATLRARIPLTSIGYFRVPGFCLFCKYFPHPCFQSNRRSRGRAFRRQNGSAPYFWWKGLQGACGRKPDGRNSSSRLVPGAPRTDVLLD